jgi:hypothetical protein
MRIGVKRTWTQRVGRRGAALLFFALLDIIYAFSLFSPPAEARRSPTLHYVAAVLPLRVWSVLWLGTGIVCLVNAFRVSDRVGFAAAIAIKMIWGMLFVGGVFVHLDRAYVSAAIWLCLAGWVAIISTWPEPPDLRPAVILRPAPVRVPESLAPRDLDGQEQ